MPEIIAFLSFLSTMNVTLWSFPYPYRANAAASDFGEPGEDGDRVGALPETLAKPTEKLSRKTGR